MALSGGNIYGAILLPSLIQVTKSISGSVVPLAMFLGRGGVQNSRTSKLGLILALHSKLV